MGAGGTGGRGGTKRCEERLRETSQVKLWNQRGENEVFARAFSSVRRWIARSEPEGGMEHQRGCVRHDKLMWDEISEAYFLVWKEGLPQGALNPCSPEPEPLNEKLSKFSFRCTGHLSVQLIYDPHAAQSPQRNTENCYYFNTTSQWTPTAQIPSSGHHLKLGRWRCCSNYTFCNFKINLYVHRKHSSVSFQNKLPT